MADPENAEPRVNWERIDSILDIVLAMPEEERDAAMERECGGDRELIDQVQRLVAADREAGNFLEDVVRDGARRALAGSVERTSLDGALANARTTPLPGAELGGGGAGEVGVPETMTLPGGGRPERTQAAPRVPSAALTGGVDLVPSRIGKYRITETIGRGGFGTVYRAADRQLARDVAIKVCHSNDAPTRQRFLKEARIAARLQHPSIVTVHDFGAFDSAGELCDEDDPSAVPFLVQEFIHGRDLHELLGEERPLQSKMALLRQIARGLWFAHRQGVVHRDVKPSNVRVQQTAGRPDSARILDFGIAGLVDEDDPIEAGTLGYLAPEVLDQMLELQPALEAGTDVTATRATVTRATSGVAAAADQFAFGVLAFEFLAGEHPFPGRSLPDVMAQMNRPEHELEAALAGVPKPLADVVLRCLARQPERRFEGMGGVVEELESAESLERPATTPSAPTRPWWRSGRATVALALLIALGSFLGWSAVREGEFRGEELQAGTPGDSAEADLSAGAGVDEVRASGDQQRGVEAAQDPGQALREPTRQRLADSALSPGSEQLSESAAPRPIADVERSLAGFTEPDGPEDSGSADSAEQRTPPADTDATPDPVEAGEEVRSLGRSSREPGVSARPIEGDQLPGEERSSAPASGLAAVSLDPSTSSDAAPVGNPEPEVLEEVTPNYPPRALRRRISATVVVAVLVDPQGQVVQTLVKSTDRADMGFERAAEEAARRTRYRQRTGEGAAPTWTEITFEFRPPVP